MCEVELSTRVYVKMILHAARYPHSTVSGALLGCRTPGCLTLCDCVPITHQLPLALSLEVALTQIDSWSALQGLVIAGFYQANSGLRDSSINSATLRSASLIAEYQDDAVLILMDNEHLSPSPGVPPLTVLHQNSNKQWVPKDKTLVMWGHWEETQRITRNLLQAKAYQRLIDFDTHLDDIRADWTNEALNREITRLAAVANGSS
ncbi:ER membrane protein complex subunit 9 [Bufo gargarizans]|uniref:ER membrane protein complex subunit 9 n=1 Tax=Bufo gargarizans TaxID=30331 RepID=UPI001CF2D256|nr:ER membrane protein complex subunit 9 [Bufo gargarizans]XP_044143325.1 ER membrane protein complex subunit 9 [Bufo gargarizans]XP_044143332.1 ER membrane protein complex subunit 9 [Bufo gargarizans]